MTKFKTFSGDPKIQAFCQKLKNTVFILRPPVRTSSLFPFLWVNFACQIWSGSKHWYLLNLISHISLVRLKALKISLLGLFLSPDLLFRSPNDKNRRDPLGVRHRSLQGLHREARQEDERSVQKEHRRLDPRFRNNEQKILRQPRQQDWGCRTAGG